MPEENFWTLWCKGRLTEADTQDHPAGGHSIRTNQCPPPPSHFFYRPDALPVAQPTASKHWRLPVTDVIIPSAQHSANSYPTDEQATHSLNFNVSIQQTWCKWKNIATACSSKPVHPRLFHIFHLHNGSSACELEVRHCPHPVYLGITLDHNMSKQHSRQNIESRQLPRKHASSSCTDDNKKMSSMVDLCYSVAQKCYSVWHILLIVSDLADIHLNSYHASQKLNSPFYTPSLKGR